MAADLRPGGRILGWFREATASLEPPPRQDRESPPPPAPTESEGGEAPSPAGNLIFRDRNQTEFLPASFGAPLDSVDGGKIVVFGLPKSGNVWLVSLLCDYTGLPPVHPILDVECPGVGMCHLPYTDFMAQRGDFVHAVYLLRDIRDVIVSYYHNSQTKWFQDDLPNFHYETIEEFYFEWFLPRVVPMHQIHTHADAYVRFGLPIIRYERLCEAPERELGRLVKRLGLPYDEDRIRQSVANNRIEKLRAEGRMLNRMVPPTHFRKGGHGNYRTELPPHILQHATLEFHRLIARWGYPT